MPNYFQAPPLPSAFIWRRAHSLTGLWLVLFLMEHLLTNSQAALFLGEDGRGFVNAVNNLRDLPYIQVIEIVLLGIPLLIHGVWGIKYLFTSLPNISKTDGSKPSLPQYPLNHAYTWQRITSWILLFGIIAHVIHMRFLQYPESVQIESHQEYFVKVQKDSGLYTLSQRLGFTLYDLNEIKKLEDSLIEKQNIQRQIDLGTPEILIKQQQLDQKKAYVNSLKKFSLNQDELIVAAPSFGLAELMMVRDTFKSPLMILLYTGLVLAASFHAFNGLWTGMISWGITLTYRSQQIMRSMAVGLMILVTFLGLSAIWGTYWVNLTY